MTRHLVAVLAVSLVILTAALVSPGHALLLGLGLAAGPWLLRYLRPEPPVQPRAGRATGATAAAGDGPPADMLATDVLASDVLTALPLPALVVDGRANVVAANAAMRSAYPALSVGTPLAFALRFPQLIDAVTAVLADGSTRQVELVERVPVERAFSAIATALGGTPPRPQALVLLRETSKERAIEAMRADFVANASHELRTPLASILGFIETLQGVARDDARARERFLGVMATQARRMSRLVDDLLSLSRIELKEHIAPTEPVDVAALTGDVVLALSELAREAGVDIAFARPQTPAMVAGDRDELYSAFENLIENAIKYGKAGGRVDVAVDRSPDMAGAGQVRLTVRDHGPGIPTEALPRLTERFYRVDTAMSRAEGGTGLGLALVKHTVNRHRGRLAIENADGGGARFAVLLARLPETVADGLPTRR